MCGRHAPAWRCRVNGRFLNVCLHCIYTLGLSCGPVRLGAPARSRGEARAASGLEPDEALLERLSARRVAKSARRRRRA